MCSSKSNWLTFQTESWIEKNCNRDNTVDLEEGEIYLSFTSIVLPQNYCCNECIKGCAQMYLPSRIKLPTGLVVVMLWALECRNQHPCWSTCLRSIVFPSKMAQCENTHWLHTPTREVTLLSLLPQLSQTLSPSISLFSVDSVNNKHHQLVIWKSSMSGTQFSLTTLSICSEVIHITTCYARVCINHSYAHTRITMAYACTRITLTYVHTRIPYSYAHTNPILHYVYLRQCSDN